MLLNTFGGVGGGGVLLLVLHTQIVVGSLLYMPCASICKKFPLFPLCAPPPPPPFFFFFFFFDGEILSHSETSQILSPSFCLFSFICWLWGGGGGGGGGLYRVNL